MKRINFYLLISLLAVLSTGCRKEQNPANADPEQFCLSGKIQNYDPADGNIFAFGGFIVTSTASPEGMEIFSIEETKINTDGSFYFINVPAPPDSLFLEKNSSTGNYTYHNRGFFYGTDLPFMHEYVVSGGLMHNRNSLITRFVSCYNKGEGLSSNVNSNTNQDPYSVMFCYIDRQYQYKKTEIKPSYEPVTQVWQYNLKLQKGWNRVYLRTSSRTQNSKTIEVTTSAPGTDFQWWPSYNRD